MERRDEPDRRDGEHRRSGREDDQDGRVGEVDDLEDGEPEPAREQRAERPTAQPVGDGREQPFPKERRVGEPGPDADGEREPAVAGLEPAQVARREPGEQGESDDQGEELARPSRRGGPVAVLVAERVERSSYHYPSVRRGSG